ncbi:DNA polymerase III subunit beta [Nanchangia anserum]|uniref:Beta sliding clamp n=1 Tax=Nanchangia anserum TaxID=2692125 RepID=A0A8I0KW34_9ACTO|nr:DNA polymerase III subunit beta [Nanchangia anserum]MBD3689589.1 DNA polymerase III subunit beta [Nanchangia anserum]QOX81772.1 DNA polymerase III subunit beta [Nanchangia anserum]
MKFRVDRAALADAVTWTARTLPQRPAIAVLAGVRLVAEDGQLTLSSFDYEVSATSHVEADVDVPGEVLVSGRLLADICKSLPDQPVDVALDGAKVTIACGAAHFTLASMAMDSYPQLPTMPALIGHADSAKLAQAVSQVARAAARDDTLPLLTTIHLEFSGDQLTLMATDRYRLAVRTLEWQPEDPEISMTAIVKSKTLQDMTKSLNNAGDAAISLATADGAPKIIGMEQTGRRMTSQLTDGDYPPVAKLFPEVAEATAVIDRQELISAVSRVALVAERSAPVRLTFAGDQVELEAGRSDDAEASEKHGCAYRGEPIQSAFNPSYLLDGLTALNQPYARLSYTEGTKPVVITGQEAPGEDDSQEMRYLLMPIRFF